MSDTPDSPQKELDRQMIRHLLNRYTREDLARMFQEETRSPQKPDSDAASLLSSCTASTTTTATTASDRSSVFDTASIRSFSDAGSISSGSIFSNVSSKLLGRKLSHSSQSSITGSSASTAKGSVSSTPAASSALSSSSSSKQKAVFSCGFCSEERIVKTCTRKNDLKRHMEDFHNMNAQWICRHRGCQMIFDWQTAFKAHLKQFHGGSRMSLDEAKVNLCPQVVFACGFSKCQSVFEAIGDLDAPSVFREYVAHVVRHFDDGAQLSGEWNYNTRMRNLLRQSQVARVWGDLGWDETTQRPLNWNPNTSLVLRKRLECRHIGNAQLLMQYAVQLGTQPDILLKPDSSFMTPVKDSCLLSIPGHINNRPAMVQAETPTNFDFRISRASNPALATYLASQRQVKASARRPQRAHYSSRSAGVAPTLSSSSSNHGHGCYYTPTSQSNDILRSNAIVRTPSVYDTHQQAAFARAQGDINSLGTSGGIIADDLQSLRNMAGGGEDTRGDVSMMDAEMLAQDFQHGYTGMGTGTVDMGPLNHHSPFFDDPVSGRPY